MEKSSTILVIDDDLRFRSLIESHLKTYGFKVDGLSDGKDLLNVLKKGPIDLIILDLGLPGEDGLSICRRLRREHDVPILMLTARGGELDRIIGLEMGADDYLAKPFHPRELVARVQAILRRTRLIPSRSTQLHQALEIGDFYFDPGRQEVFRDGQQLSLTHSEYLLLMTLVRYQGEAVSREQLLWATRGRQLEAEDRSVDMQISRLRRLLGEDGADIIRTVWGQGYRFVPPE